MISEKLILLDSDIHDKEHAISYLIAKLHQENYINDADEFKKSVYDREHQMSTNVGYGVAMPHGRSEAVNQAFIAFMRVKEPFKWDETEDTVQLIFMIGVSPDEGMVHLKYISEISKLLMHETFRESLLTLENKQEIMKLFRKED